MRKKILPTTEETLDSLFGYLSKGYNENPKNINGDILFKLSHNKEIFTYTLSIKNNVMTISKRQIEEPKVSVESSVFDWLNVAAKRLNTFFALVTRRLKVKGDIFFFRKAMPSNLIERDLSDYKDKPTPFEKQPRKYWKKLPKVCVINGAHTGENGVTSLLLKPFIEGMKEAGSEVEEIVLKEKKIEPCLGCYQCWLNKDKTCIIKDDLNGVYDKMEDSDLLVMAFPIYVDNMPGRVKTFLDRTIRTHHPFFIKGRYKTRHPRRLKKNRALAVFSVCGFPEEKHFTPVHAYFKEWSHNTFMPIVAEIYRTSSMAIYYSPLHYPVLVDVYNALRDGGNELIKKGKISGKTMKRIKQSPQSIKAFRDHSNGFWMKAVNDDTITL